MSDVAFADFTNQILSLTYEQTIILMEKMLESLKTKKQTEAFSEIGNDVSTSHMAAMWEELKNDTW